MLVGYKARYKMVNRLRWIQGGREPNADVCEIQVTRGHSPCALHSDLGNKHENGKPTH